MVRVQWEVGGIAVAAAMLVVAGVALLGTGGTDEDGVSPSPNGPVLDLLDVDHVET